MENIKTADVFKRMAKWQLAATFVVALAAALLAGVHGAVSALAGGFSAIAGSFVAALIARNNDAKKEAGAILIGLLKAEAVKVLVIALLLLITFKVYTQHLVPLALIMGLAAAAILSGAAIFGLNESADK